MATARRTRGMKRTCQSSECEQRFYDLEREPIVCPHCGTIYEIASAPLADPPAPEKIARSNKPVPPQFVAEEVVEAEEIVIPEDAVLDEAVETAVEPIAEEADETFLEEEEGGDVSNIIGPVDEGEEEV